ncbi:DUF1289 domain-containing protein [Agarivorans sp. Z349TD_8]|uniref:DUF1289 domain-containing protein n=1 Tax=Agarivorans sp. Z349TD_8 TaxID=3421434 RepID=UPI003D7D39F8
MEQLEIFDIPNPCRGICQTNSRGLCLGCFRSRQERFAWQTLDSSQQQNILRLSKQRRQRYIRKQRQLLAEQAKQQSGTSQTEFPF